MDNPLEKFFFTRAKHVVDKWHHYFEIYHRHFQHLRGKKDITILEIGVQNGGSLAMWNDYFGSDCVTIYGIDILSACKKMEDLYPNMKIFIGDQSNVEFLTSLKEQIPKLDIIVDDGGHLMNQQKTSFDHLYSHLKDDGVYLCEDLHTSYWSSYGGGYLNTDSFVEYMKSHIDKLNAYHSNSNNLKVTSFTSTTNSMHFYDSVVVIEKRIRQRPICSVKGIKRLV